MKIFQRCGLRWQFIHIHEPLCDWLKTRRLVPLIRVHNLKDFTPKIKADDQILTKSEVFDFLDDQTLMIVYLNGSEQLNRLVTRQAHPSRLNATSGDNLIHYEETFFCSKFFLNTSFLCCAHLQLKLKGKSQRMDKDFEGHRMKGFI